MLHSAYYTFSLLHILEEILPVNRYVFGKYEIRFGVYISNEDAASLLNR